MKSGVMEMPKTKIMKMRLGKQCVICEKRKEEGILIAKSFICTTCEHEMVHLDDQDHLYHEYIKQMRAFSSQYV